jgi:uncharacterized protein (TIGR03437 family)
VYSTTGFTVVEIAVSQALNISKVTAQLQVEYPQDGDLNVFLYSSYGTRTKLLERNCGSLQNINTTFDDSASTKFSSFCPAEAGRGPFQGNEPLANSNGQSSFGVWRLAIQNNGTPRNFGTIQAVSVTITGTPISRPTISPDAVVSEASLLPGMIAPGQRIIVFGSGLGPDPGVSAPDGNLPSTLGGTTVLIDGISAAISYASATRAEVIVPYGEIPGTNALIRVAYAGQTSELIALGVRTAKPGVYVSGESGTHVNASNQDGSVNSPASPAPKGTYVTVYAVGLGITNPLTASGVVAPTSSLVYTNNPILAFVGGVQAPVAFAGLAPGLIGVYQINIQIPNSVASGPQDLAIIAINGASSQDGIQIDIQ